MRTHVLLLLISTLINFNSFSQTNDQAETSKVDVSTTSSDQILPYYVIIADTAQLEVTGEALERDYGGMSSLEPNWIEEIHVYKGEKAKELYGENGNDGVVVITIKNENIVELPEGIIAALKPIDKS